MAFTSESVMNLSLNGNSRAYNFLVQFISDQEFKSVCTQITYLKFGLLNKYSVVLIPKCC